MLEKLQMLTAAAAVVTIMLHELYSRVIIRNMKTTFRNFSYFSAATSALLWFQGFFSCSRDSLLLLFSTSANHRRDHSTATLNDANHHFICNCKTCASQSSEMQIYEMINCLTSAMKFNIQLETRRLWDFFEVSLNVSLHPFSSYLKIKALNCNSKKERKNAIKNVE